jgi:hypothetical protein
MLEVYVARLPLSQPLVQLVSYLPAAMRREAALTVGVRVPRYVWQRAVVHELAGALVDNFEVIALPPGRGRGHRAGDT